MITIFHTGGRRIQHQNIKVIPGTQLIKIKNLPSGIYLIDVLIDGLRYTGKLISLNPESTGDVEISQEGMIGEKKSIAPVSMAVNLPSYSGKSIVHMIYYQGDRILFTGKSGNYRTIISMIPSQSQNLNFVFVPCTDADGNHYPVVHIGNQTWMAENLKTTHYRNGDSIHNETNASQWPAQTIGAWCSYNNSPDSIKNWGLLYNWYAVNDNRKMAPQGWRIPKTEDFDALSQFLGGNTLAGGKLKETGFTFWNSPNTAASNETGFCARGAGLRNLQGLFNYLKNTLYLWTSSTDFTGTNMYFRYLSFAQETFPQSTTIPKLGYSVRCILGELPEVILDSVNSITSYSANAYARVTVEGSLPVSERGFCWGLHQNPTKNNAFAVCGSGLGSFNNFISGLMSYYYSSKYYVRAYSTNGFGTTYSNQLDFYTQPGNPFIDLLPFTNVTPYSATTGGIIDTTGGFNCTARGVCWRLSPNLPYVYDSNTVDGSGTGTYTSVMTGLKPGKTYNVRAYCTNQMGTFYHFAYQSVTTPPVPPELTTGNIIGYTYPTALSGGNITYDGGAPITARGVCWNLNWGGSPPTLSDAHTVDGTGTGIYSSTITGLAHGTHYRARAYATNSAGTTYGNIVDFVSQLSVGQPYQGGVVAYIFQSWDPGFVWGEVHGLIASINSSIGTAEWGCGYTWVNTNQNILTGQTNTNNILAACPTPGIAARLCDDYVSNGYSDWFLPSINELEKIHMNRNAIGYLPGWYWSSTQSTNSGDAWGVSFITDNSGTAVKGAMGYVRAVRYF